jgi:putative membrane protein
MGVVALLVLTLATAAPAAWAHAPQVGAEAAQGALWQCSLEPWVVSLLALSAALYALGVARLWRHAGRFRGIGARQAAAFTAGWIILVAALVSPLDAISGYLFSAHMVQHELLMVVVAPLMVLGRPLAAWAWAFSPAQRQAIGRWLRVRWWASSWALLTDSLVAWALHALALWLWHVPQFFEAALRNEGWHALQHACFLGTALLFWWAVLGRDRRSRHNSGFAMAYLFTTMLHTSALGALLTLAPTPWYESYVATSTLLGIDPVQDQQLGGLVMWIPGGFAYVAAGLVMVARLLARPALNPAIATSPGPTR